MKKLILTFLAMLFVTSPAYADHKSERWVRDNRVVYYSQLNSHSHRNMVRINQQYPLHVNRPRYYQPRYYNAPAYPVVDRHVHVNRPVYRHRHNDVEKALQVLIGTALIVDALDH